MGEPPKLSLADRQAALAKAAAARRVRADVKSAIKRGELTLSDVLKSEIPAVRKMRVQQLLVTLPGIGLVRAELIMKRCGISPTRRVQGLGVHQLSELKKELGI